MAAQQLRPGGRTNARHRESTHVTSWHVTASGTWSSTEQRHDVVVACGTALASQILQGSTVRPPMRTVEASRTWLNLTRDSSRRRPGIDCVHAQSGDSYLESTCKSAEAARAVVVREPFLTIRPDSTFERTLPGLSKRLGRRGPEPPYASTPGSSGVARAGCFSVAAKRT
jgi:hypothetical protein